VCHLRPSGDCWNNPEVNDTKHECPWAASKKAKEAKNSPLWQFPRTWELPYCDAFKCGKLCKKCGHDYEKSKKKCYRKGKKGKKRQGKGNKLNKEEEQSLGEGRRRRKFVFAATTCKELEKYLQPAPVSFHKRAQLALAKKIGPNFARSSDGTLANPHTDIFQCNSAKAGSSPQKKEGLCYPHCSNLRVRQTQIAWQARLGIGNLIDRVSWRPLPGSCSKSNADFKGVRLIRRLNFEVKVAAQCTPRGRILLDPRTEIGDKLRQWKSYKGDNSGLKPCPQGSLLQFRVAFALATAVSCTQTKGCSVCKRKTRAQILYVVLMSTLKGGTVQKTECKGGGKRAESVLAWEKPRYPAWKSKNECSPEMPAEWKELFRLPEEFRGTCEKPCPSGQVCGLNAFLAPYISLLAA